MNEPLDDELRRYVAALREVDRPGDGARAATWAGIDARIAEDLAPPRPAWRTWPLAALAAAVVLGVGLAAATAWRVRAEANVEAAHQRIDAPTLRSLEKSSRESPQSASRGQSPHPEPPASTSGKPEHSPIGAASASESSAATTPSDPSTAPSVGPAGDSQDLGASDPAAVEKTPHARSPSAESSGNARPSAARRPADSPSLRPEEVASFQRAQAALAAGRYDDALSALDAHGRRFERGVFEEERQVSRATALCKLGRLDDAADARRRFLRERPGSHLAERMRQICRDDE
ncbi:hypothetical protein [Nannocystis bainbridge]|uniref:Tetratricopeptide repeat protein n=1 Tax=Nannocystis bainbridge TaxID=2995303 RepID=A0ABT5EDR9_9BACT|nr:hypothetical protein [Nannocystis bainbridge]MDC0723705.1 hypothetical protein [Nannocystis bainbridge]